MELSPHNPKGFKQRGFSFFKVVGTTCLLSGIGVAAFFAWDQGHIPGNKRALSAEAMREAIEMKIALDASEPSAPCVYSHSWDGIKDARKGLPGIAWEPVPGLWSVSHFIDDMGAQTASTKRNLKAKEFFSKQGFYDRKQVTVNTDSGLVDAVQFTLNLDGYFAARSYKYPKECFPIGERALHKITAFKKLDETVVGQEAWKVDYQTELVNQPEWAASAEAREVFHAIKDYDRLLEHSTVLIRGEDKWVLEDIAFLQLSRSQVNARDSRKLQKLNKQLFLIDAPPLQVDEAADIFSAYIKSDRWYSDLACLPFNLTSGGDDRSLASNLRRQGSQPFTAHYFDVDLPQRKRIRSSALATELYIWNALSAGGFVDIAPLEKGTYKFYDKYLENPDGVKVTLNKDIGNLLNVNTYRRCIPFGTFDVEFLGIKPQKMGAYEVLAIGKPKGTPDWVMPIAAKWPALKHAIDNGVVISGIIHYESVVTEVAQLTRQGEWRIQKLKIHYPRTRHHELPPVFQPLLQRSQNSWPLLKGPLNVQALQNKSKSRVGQSNGVVREAVLKETKLRQPKAKSVLNNNHSVTISSPFEPNYVKKQLTAEYGGAGAATPWSLSKVYSSGRYYFEAQGNTVGQLSYSGHANISFSETPKRDHFGFGGIMLIRHGEQKLRSNQDIFGIAIDYDNGTLYHHINGEWMTGAPGDNAGLKIKKNTPYSPIFVATGNKKGRKGVYWDINLGRNGFTYEIPKGFKPYGS